jgi:hypothetical protein
MTRRAPLDPQPVAVDRFSQGFTWLDDGPHHAQIYVASSSGGLLVVLGHATLEEGQLPGRH